MPQIKSQKKRVKISEKQRLANNSKKSALKTAMKKVFVAVEVDDKEAALLAYNNASKHLDKLVAKNIYHRNYAARQKSRLAKAINSLG